MQLNITVGIQTPTYTGHCNCNAFIWFTWKWDPWLLTAMNSPLSRFSQPAQSDMLKYKSTVNISHLETNTTESMGSLYILCMLNDWNSSHNLIFSTSLHVPFPCNYCHPNQYSVHSIEPTKDYRVHENLGNFIFPSCLVAAWFRNFLHILSMPYSFSEWMSEPGMLLFVHLWCILRFVV